MEKRFVFRHMEHSDAIENYANEKLAKLERVLHIEEHEPVRIDIIMTANREHHHHEIDLHISAAHVNFAIKREGPELYLLIDQVIDIAVETVQKQRKEQIDSLKEDNQFRRIK
jgi:ribosome-associated translation inhibitor RaiA